MACALAIGLHHQWAGFWRLGFDGQCSLRREGFLVLIQSAVYYFFDLLFRLIPGLTVTSYCKTLSPTSLSFWDFS